MKTPIISLNRFPAIHLSSSGCAVSLGMLVQHPCPIHFAVFLVSGLSVLASAIQIRPLLKAIAVLMAATSLFLLLPTMDAHASPNAPIRQISIDYKVVATELQNGGIPLRLPKVVVYQLPPDVNRAFYVAKGHLTDDPPGYALTIGHKDCKGANACTIALAEAQQITSSTGSIEDLFPPLIPEMIAGGVEQSPERNGWLQFANGQSVYFSGWVRAASMGYSRLTWDEGNYRYTLGLKGGKRDWLVAMANSIQ